MIYRNIEKKNELFQVEVLKFDKLYWHTLIESKNLNLMSGLNADYDATKDVMIKIEFSMNMYFLGIVEAPPLKVAFPLCLPVCL